MALPSPRRRPPFLICDADATIQALVAKEVRPFQALKTFQVQPVVVPAVLVELRSNHRYGQRVESPLRKALGNGTIRELNLAKLKEHFEQGQVDANAKALATATERAIESLGGPSSAGLTTGRRILTQPPLHWSALSFRTTGKLWMHY